MLNEVRHRKRSKDSEPVNHTTDEIRNPKTKWPRLALVFFIGIAGWYVREYSGHLGPKPNTDPMVTPLHAPSAVKSLGMGDMDRYWGSYRPGFYLGMKTRTKNSLVAGFMWMEQYVNVRGINGDFLRHKCNQDNRFKYGWKAHDGVNFGDQTIQEERFNLRTRFLKRPRLGGYGGDWTWNIQADPLDGSKPSAVTFLVYFTTDNDGSIRPIIDENNSNKLTKIVGNTSGLADFTVKFIETSGKVISYFQYREYLNSLTEIHDDTMKRLGGQMIDVKGRGSVPYYFVKDGDTKNPPSGHEHIAYVITAELPFNLEVIFESELGAPDRTNVLAGENFETEFQTQITQFKRMFAANFNLATKWSAEHIAFAESALSNMVGGMGYFYGHSRIQRGDEPVTQSWDGPLFTGVPSRSFFPRGFLWDEGFHQLLVSKFNPTISIDSICHWLDLLNQDGWIPREQILDDEARSRVPAEFIIQKNDRANPPTLLLAIDQLIDSGSLKKDQLLSIYPRLEAWFNWFNTTQYGPIPSTYTWKGRFINAQNSELNPKTLTSGLDDYPRATHPTDSEYHLDLRCWMALAAQVLGKISLLLGKSNIRYLELESQLKDFDLLNKLHWDSRTNLYADYGRHSSNVKLRKVQWRDEQGKIQYRMEREVSTLPKDQFVHHSGYITLFPLLMKIVEPDSPHLGHLLDFIRDESKIWTKYGLRSLSKDDPLYNARNTEHDPPYWRGQIWININFLTVRALEYYGNEIGPHSSRAKEIFQELRSNIVTNVFEQYQKTGFIWENYNQDTGAGQGCHPFTGWSALTVLMMKET